MTCGESSRGKELSLLQPGKGLRFSLDSVLLGAFPALTEGLRVLDMGCGSGILLLLLAMREKHLRLWGIDRNPELTALAEENCRRNGIAADILCGDAMKAASIFPGSGFDLIVSNPPYYPVADCRLPRDPAVAAARTELFWNQENMLNQAFRLLTENGAFCLSFPGHRKDEMLALAEKSGFFPFRLWHIQTKKHLAPKRFLLELKKAPAVLREETLLLYDETGAETPEMKRIWKVYDRTGTVPCGNTHRQS